MSVGDQGLARAVVDGSILRFPGEGDAGKRRTLLVFLPGFAVEPPKSLKLLELLHGEDFLGNCDLLRFQLTTEHGRRSGPPTSPFDSRRQSMGTSGSGAMTRS